MEDRRSGAAIRRARNFEQTDLGDARVTLVEQRLDEPRVDTGRNPCSQFGVRRFPRQLKLQVVGVRDIPDTVSIGIRDFLPAERDRGADLSEIGRREKDSRLRVTGGRFERGCDRPRSARVEPRLTYQKILLLYGRSSVKLVAVVSPI